MKQNALFLLTNLKLTNSDFKHRKRGIKIVIVRKSVKLKGTFLFRPFKCNVSFEKKRRNY